MLTSKNKAAIRASWLITNTTEKQAEKPRAKIDEVPSLKDFMKQSSHKHKHGSEEERIQPQEDLSGLPEYLQVEREQNKNKRYYIETHGCQMNVADTEIVETILEGAGFEKSEEMNMVRDYLLYEI